MPTRGRVARLTAVAAVLAIAAEAGAAVPPGAPDIRPARLADHAPRARFAKEWWILRLLDPRSTRRIFVSFRREGHDPEFWCCSGAGVGYYKGDAYSDPEGTYFYGWPQTGAKRLHVAGENYDHVPGTVNLKFGRRRSRVTAESEPVKANILVDRQRPGPAAMRFRLGWSQQGTYRRARLNWSSLIARGRARGTVEAGDRTVRFKGWRASYERVWGDFTETDRAWDHWDDWVVHRRRTSWFLFGLNRSDTMTGAGARDAQWLGVLARLGPDGLRMCRPELHRLHWDLYTSLYASNDRLSAECGGMRAIFEFARRGDFDAYDFEFTGPGVVNKRGDGWMVQRWTPD